MFLIFILLQQQQQQEKKEQHSLEGTKWEKSRCNFGKGKKDFKISSVITFAFLPSCNSIPASV